MTSYIIRRLLLLIPTLLGILVINFVIIQFAPGGPVERVIAKYSSEYADPLTPVAGKSTAVSKGQGGTTVQSKEPKGIYIGSEALNPAIIKELEVQFGFDKPAHVRFLKMAWDYLCFDFGKSFYRNETVLNIISEKLPVSITLGLWSTLIMYLVSIPLGIRKAVKEGTLFDIWSSFIVNVFYAIPAFVLAILLIILFAGGSYLNIFPIRGLVSNNWAELSFGAKIIDYLWHITLPVICITLSGFATLAMLTKNSFLDEMHKLYVVTARSKGLTEKAVLYKHVFRNAMLIVISGFPAAFIMAIFTGSMLIEIIFSLDGLGLMGFQAILERDYPIIFATLYIYTLLGLIMKLISDVLYTVIDPRIDFESRGV
ncbi:MAG: microcin C ABC transporter permease YejB [Deltaproteobacteria bacterium]|nr:microcin C ABC transporter permease YejB [Deltaproteobacteria bacterium]